MNICTRCHINKGTVVGKDSGLFCWACVQEMKSPHTKKEDPVMVDYILTVTDEDSEKHQTRFSAFPENAEDKAKSIMFDDSWCRTDNWTLEEI